MRMRIHIFQIALLSLALLSASCYHFGGGSHMLRHVYVDKIHNGTAEPLLGGMIHSAVNEQLGTRAYPKYVPKMDLPLDLDIIAMENSSLARAEVRDKKTRDDDSDAYQTVLYRITVKVGYTLKTPSGKVLKGEVTGIGDLPKMHDRNVPLQYALKLAASDAARKIVDRIADYEENK